MERTQPRYLISNGWAHLFEGFGPRTVRFVFDRDWQELVAMEIEYASGWQPALSAERADVQDSLLTANEDALVTPAAWGLIAAADLPDWAKVYDATTEAPAASSMTVSNRLLQELCAPVGNAQWQELCAQQGWNDATKVTIFERFLQENDLFERFTNYAASVADEENSIE